MLRACPPLSTQTTISFWASLKFLWEVALLRRLAANLRGVPGKTSWASGEFFWVAHCW